MMFFIGLGLGALLMLIIIVIYTSLMVASWSDNKIDADFEYYDEDFEKAEGRIFFSDNSRSLLMESAEDFLADDLEDDESDEEV